jgi:hypothetical protein
MLEFIIKQNVMGDSVKVRPAPPRLGAAPTQGQPQTINSNMRTSLACHATLATQPAVCYSKVSCMHYPVKLTHS